jgi:ABC-type polysaccharide/polyol phosphate transport system ATPase subunit
MKWGRLQPANLPRPANPLPWALIEFAGVSKSFRHGAGSRLLRGHIQQWLRGRKSERFYALRDVSFRLEAGEGMAVVGRNGAGKSTLLSLVAGLSRPNQGRVTVEGRVAALLELGSGFHHDLTGVENLRLNASLLGLSRRRTEEVAGAIADFADIGDFLREPLRTYSTGMLMRLAFAIAVHVDPDILIVDEVLAVGDQAFQAKCFERIRQFKSEGKTLLFVSHATQLVREICSRGLWLEHGQVVMDGGSAEVLEAYTGLPAGVPYGPG